MLINSLNGCLNSLKGVNMLLTKKQVKQENKKSKKAAKEVIKNGNVRLVGNNFLSEKQAIVFDIVKKLRIINNDLESLQRHVPVLSKTHEKIQNNRNFIITAVNRYFIDFDSGLYNK